MAVFGYEYETRLCSGMSMRHSYVFRYEYETRLCSGMSMRHGCVRV